MPMKLSMLPKIPAPCCRDEIAINDRPRVHEDDLDIEEDEEHRHEIELHAEPGLRPASESMPHS